MGLPGSISADALLCMYCFTNMSVLECAHEEDTFEFLRVASSFSCVLLPLKDVACATFRLERGALELKEDIQMPLLLVGPDAQ